MSISCVVYTAKAIADQDHIDCHDPWIDKAFEHLLVAELLDWFKNDFFSWMDDVKCEKCSISGRKLEAVGRYDHQGNFILFVFFKHCGVLKK